MLLKFIRQMRDSRGRAAAVLRSQPLTGAQAGADLTALRHHLQGFPLDVEAWVRLGEMLQTAGDDREALASYERCLAVEAGHAVATCLAAALAAKLGLHDRALDLYRRALELVPEQAAAILTNMGASHRALVQIPDAIACFERAIGIDPGLAEASYNLGTILNDLGRIDEAERLVRRAVELRPDFHQAHSTLLCIHGLHRNHDQRALLEEHRRWSAAHASGFAPLSRRADVDLTSERRLTIGYVSGDFCEHSVSFFIEPVLARHDRSRFRIICYDNWPGQDAVNLRLRRYAEEWRRISHLNDDEAAALILEDRVDILVDLSGHTVGNRLLVFARKPAPIQATWFGYMCTTGLAAMDYRITDAYFDPPGATEQNYTEKLCRISCVVAFAPAPDCPPVNAAPVLTRGGVTFGSFNNYTKIGDEVIAAWVRILNALPSSRLLLVALGGDDASVRQRIEQRFAGHGLAAAPGKLEIRGRRPMRDFLHALQEVDIALDPFPYSGGTTSLHTLWMGVPIISIEGDTELSRSTSAMMRGAGADSLVATSVDRYCEIAIELARNNAELSRWRASLRERLSASPFFAGAEVTLSLENAYRAMWRKWREEATASG